MTRLSPAQQSRERILAAMGGRVIAANGVHVRGAVASLNDNAPAPHAGKALNAYELKLIELNADRRRLKEIQSRERKIALKAELLPKYAAWIEGVLASAAQGGRAVQDEVFTTVMLWRIDVGDYAGALPLAAYVLRYNLAMPERFNREAAVLIAEEIAEGALRSLLPGGPGFNIAVLAEVEDLTADHDMPDEVRAKLMKAMGLELARQAEDGDAGAAQRTRRSAALKYLRRARELNEACGVKQLIDKLDKALVKAPSDTPPGTPPAADPS